MATGMVKDSPAEVGAPDVWQVESVRATVFRKVAPPTGVGAQWERVAGAVPTTASAELAEGLLARGRLAIGAKEGRSDLSYFAPEEREALGPCTDVVRQFAALVAPWFELLAVDFHRVSFGLVLQQTAQTRERANEIAARYLPALHVEPYGCSDLVYQINRWRRSHSVVEVSIDRLSRWSVLPLVRTTPDHVVRVELDVSSSASVDARLDADRALDLVDEEIELALEMARRGDVP
jgi:hypothetical protein